MDTSEIDVGESPLSTDVLVRGEHLDKSFERTRVPEPEFETAMRWSNGQSPSEIYLDVITDADTSQHTSIAASTVYLEFLIE